MFGFYFNETQNEIWNKLCELDGETVARLFTDYYGNRLMDAGFKEFLEDEGIM
jgi:hypothetical protein